MNADKDRMRQAYIDGELSASEIASFEATLTPAEKEQIASEMQFEFALADRLRHEAHCPDSVWQRTKAQMANARPAPARNTARRVYQGAFAAATLAVVAAMVLFVINYDQTPAVPFDPSSLATLSAATVDELAALSTIAPGEESAEAFLNEHGVNLHIEPLESLPIARVHHDLKLLGARSVPAGSGEAFEILVACCGFPEKIVLAHQGSQAAATIGQATSVHSQVQATRTVGKYIAAVVGVHQAHGLLDLFTQRIARAY